MAVEIVEAETSKCDVAETPVRRRQLWLLVLPVLFLGLYCVFVHARGPFYIRPNSDPDYLYLFNSLNIATGKPSTLVHHPGTTLQLLGAVVIKAAHISARRAKLSYKVLQQAEQHLQAINYTLAAMYFIALVLGALAIFRRTGQWLPALFLQVTPFFLGNQFEHVARVSAESMLLVFGIIMVALLYLQSLDHRVGARMVLLLGFVTASSIATKLSFLPLGLAALFSLGCWRQRAKYVTWTFLFTCLWLIPLAPHGHELAEWVIGLTAHQGLYGTGNAGVLPQNYFRNLVRLVTEYPWMFLTVLLSWLTVILRVGLGSGQRPQAERWLWLLAGLAAGESFQMLMVAKFAQWRYLLPTLIFCPLNVLLILNLVQIQWHDHIRWPQIRKLATVSGCIALGIASVALGRQYFISTRAASARLEIVHATETEFQNETTVFGAVTSSPYYALWFGNFFAGGWYTPVLRDQVLHAHRPAYCFEGDGFVWLSGQRLCPFSEFVRQHGSFILSAPTKIESRMAPALPPGTRVEKLIEKSGEAIYRVSY